MIGDYGEAALRQKIKTRCFGRVMYVLDTVNSTNDYAKALAAGGAAEGTLVTADHQSAGRGSGNRRWVSPPNTNIYASCVLIPPFQPRRMRELGILAAYSIARTLRERQGVPVRLKWPNDLVLGGKKIGGLLSEGDAIGDRVSWLVIGLGLNVNTPAFPPELEGRAGSLALECGRPFDRGDILAAYLGRLEAEYGRYTAEDSLEYLVPAYDALLIHRGQPVRLVQAQKETLVLSRGINRFGELRVQEEDGTIRPVGIGEVSVRGPEGYV
jgi:BirA family biotin operon repressor/biotin-[acetyl-CoA-carboxylase] ligase